MINVFVIAEVTVFREALAAALERANSIRIVATAARCARLEADMTAYRPAVLLVDVPNLGAATGLGRAPPLEAGPRVVVVGVSEAEDDIIACAEAGASGYLTRNGSLGDLVATIEGVARDELHLPPRIAAALVRRVGALAAERRLSPVGDRLTRRELEILSLVTDGLSNREIARMLCITVATVKNHVHNIFEKLDVSTRAEASARAYDRTPS
jgi:DNA-binding NarL/FixJ family response regulator